jgi:ribonuclease Z
MELTLLGTASGTPSRTRNVTAAAVRFEDGSIAVVDCGEGTQQRLLPTDLSPARIGAVLITHLHGDHCFGLPGLLCSIGVHGRSEPVLVAGPPGTAELLATVLRLSDTSLPYSYYVEEISDGHVVRFGRVTASAWPLRHRVPCWGWVLQEDARPGRVDAAAAAAAGITGARLGALVRESLSGGDGGGIVGPPRPGRKLVILGDTCGSQAIHAAGAGCDLLVHEATYGDDRVENAARWGHSTAAQAAACAAAMGARRLLLTHFSSRYDQLDSIADLLAQAQATAPGIEVHAGHDWWRARVPLPDETTGDAGAGGAPTLLPESACR